MGSTGGKTTGGITPVRSQDIKDKATSTTKSAIAKGTVVITSQQNQKQNIEALNRDTKDSLNKLAQIFDKEDVKERQELVDQFSQIVNEKIGDIAAEKGWAPNDPRRVALHALAGGLTTHMGGGSATAGAVGAGVMESLQPVLDQFVKDHPDMREDAAVLIGGTVGKLVGDKNAGEAAAWSSTKFNWLTHEQYEQYLKELNNAGAVEKRNKVLQYWEKIDKEKKFIYIPGTYWDLENNKKVIFTNPLEAVTVTGTREYGMSIFESGVGSGMDFRSGWYAGTALFTSWDIWGDSDVTKYGIQGAARRVRIDIVSALGLGIATKGRGLATGSGISIPVGVIGMEFKDSIAPELSPEEKKRQDEEYIESMKYGID